MKSHNRDMIILYLVILCGWIFFIFSEGILSHKQISNITKNISKITEDITERQTLQQKSYQQNEEKQIIGQFANTDFNSIQKEKIDGDVKYENIQKLHIKPENITKVELKNIVKHTGSNFTFEDIGILEELYKTTKNDDVIQILIKKLINDYQFNKAYLYANKLISKNGIKSIDANMYLTIWMNSSQLSVINTESINKFKTLVENYRSENLLTTDYYRFYQAMINLRNNNIEGSLVLLKQITSPHYIGLYNSIFDIHNQISQQKDMPQYYENALISLQLFKQGYFVFAKKLALDVLEKNDDYILPYQILAYSSFLSNSRDSSIDYFIKLTEIDKDKSEKYKFFIGVSYFRLDKIEDSVLYLSQVKNNILKDKSIDIKYLLTDTYRYLLLDYRKADDKTNMIKIRQKLLGQNDIGKSDFYLYFFEIFFKPTISAKKYILYNKNPILANEYINQCYVSLAKSEQDICLYGHAGFDYLNGYSDKAEKKLLYIVKKYPQSYIYHTLGDIYYKNSELEKAKNYYIKAVSTSNKSGEEQILRYKISQVMNGL